VLLGTGELERALELASQAVDMDHTCAWALSIRGQARLLAGDREGALADLDRAWGRVVARYRHECSDLWGTRAALRGKPKKAQRLWKRYGKGPDLVCANDLARLERLRAAVVG
jgi:hypothetical protein